MTILTFGIAREIIGNSLLELELPATTTVEHLKALLIARYPRLGELTSLLIAVNMEYAPVHQILKASDEVALIPPVSGG